MSRQKQSSFPGLPSRYSRDGCFQHGTGTGASGWAGQEPESYKRSPRVSQPCSVTEMERSYTNSYPSSGVLFQGENPLNGTPGPWEPSHSNSAWRESSRGERARSMSPLRGIHSVDSGIVVTNDMECARKHSSPPLRRRHSLSRLPDWGTEEYGPMRPLARRVWSGLELDLRASLPENVQRTVGLGPSLRDAPGVLEGQAEELQKLELNRVKFELLSIKQKQMESSLTRLEKEKSWLDLSRYEDQKQRGDLQEKILNLEMEVVKAKSCLSRMSCRSVSPSPSQRLSVEKEELNREMTALQETLSDYKEHMKALEAERDEMAQQLNSAKEGKQLAFSQTGEANQRVTDSLQATKALHKEIGRLQAAYSSTSREKELLSSKVARLEERVSELTLKLKPALSDRERFLKEKVELHLQVQDLTLQLEHAQLSREGFNGQMSDLHLELVNAKAQANRQDQEKVLMKEELVTLRQVNEKLSSELGQNRQRLEASLDQLHHLEAEKKILTNRIQALETERTRLLGEQEALKSEMQRDAGGQGNDVAALQTTCEGLRASQSLLQAEKEALQARCMELEAALQQKQEELCGQLAEQQQISQHWKDRWNQVAVALKTKEEELEQAHVARQSLSAKHTELLEDCELLQTDVEELAELRGTVHSLKEENRDLMRQLREQQQATQLLQLQELATNTSVPGSGSERTSEQEALYKEIQETRDKIKRLENEKAEMKSEIRKLKLDGASILRIELDACKQELELEKSRSQALNGKVKLLQSRCWDKATPPHEQIKFPTTSNTTATSGLEKDCPVSSPGSSQISSPQGEALAMESPQGLMTSGGLSEVESLKQKLQRETASQQEQEELIWTLREELEELKLKQPGDIKASLEEVDTELVLVREELQKVWDMLKTRDMALEEQHLELESARSQYTECSSEKLRLEQLIASLEHQLAEREQDLRHLRQASEMEKTKLEIQASSLELKLAEVEVLRDDLHRRDRASGTPEVQNWGPRQSRDSCSQGKCSRCDAFLAQLNKMIQSCTEKGAVLQEDQALTYLCELQGLLKGLSQYASGQVIRSPQEKSQALEQQHRLVTEQLKGLFRQRQQLQSGHRKLSRDQKDEGSLEQWVKKSQVNTRGAITPHGKPPLEPKEKQQPVPHLGFSTNTEEAQSLRRQLQEKTEMISAMASEIQGLQQKNEHLMKAKLRFQQQIQDIRSLQHERQERSDSDLLVPRLSSQQELELGLSQWSDGSAPPTGGDPPASSLCPPHSRVALYLAKQVVLPEAGDDELRCFSSESSGSQSHRSQAGSEPPAPLLSKLPADPVTGKLPPPSSLPLPISSPASGKSSPKARSSPVSPRSQTGGQESSYTPKGAVLLSPRPFRAQRLGSPFKFRVSPEPPGESCGS